MPTNRAHLMFWWGWPWLRGWGKLLVTQLYALSSGRWERHGAALWVELVAGQNLTSPVDTFLLTLSIRINGTCLLHPKARTVCKGNFKYLGIAAPRAPQSICLLDF